jgi:hypothetical protein
VQHGLLKLVAMVGGRKEPTLPAHGNLLREQEISPTCAASYLPGSVSPFLPWQPKEDDWRGRVSPLRTNWLAALGAPSSPTGHGSDGYPRGHPNQPNGTQKLSYLSGHRMPLKFAKSCSVIGQVQR